jgi:hypothetical protein
MTEDADSVADLMELEFSTQRITSMLPPRRRLWVEVCVHADDDESMVDALRDIVNSIERGCRGGVSGSVSYGAHFRVTEDMRVTPPTYQEALKTYLAMLNGETHAAS